MLSARGSMKRSLEASSKGSSRQRRAAISAAQVVGEAAVALMAALAELEEQRRGGLARVADAP